MIPRWLTVSTEIRHVHRSLGSSITGTRYSPRMDTSRPVLSSHSCILLLAHIVLVWCHPGMGNTMYCTRIFFTIYITCSCVSDIAFHCPHYSDVIMNAMASQITGLTIVYSTVYSGTDKTKHQSSASLALCGEFTGHQWVPPHKGPVTRKMFPFDDVIMFVNAASCTHCAGRWYGVTLVWTMKSIEPEYSPLIYLQLCFRHCNPLSLCCFRSLLRSIIWSQISRDIIAIKLTNQKKKKRISLPPSTGFPQKSQKKVPWFFHQCPWLHQAKIQISRQKIPIFVSAAHVSICKINYRQTQTHTHTQMIWLRPTDYSADFTCNWTDPRSQNYTC